MKHTTPLRTVLRTIAALLTASFLVVGLAACAGAGSKVPGAYRDANGYGLILTSDGTIIQSGSETGTWTVENDGGDWLVFDFDSVDYEWRADLSDGIETLTLTAGGGFTQVLTRVPEGE